MLVLEGITVAFDGFTVLDDLSLRVGRGELRFLIGPNGAGKTTLLDLLTGKVRPLSGTATYDGEVDLTKETEHVLARLGIRSQVPDARDLPQPHLLPAPGSRARLPQAGGGVV